MTSVIHKTSISQLNRLGKGRPGQQRAGHNMRLSDRLKGTCRRSQPSNSPSTSSGETSIVLMIDSDQPLRYPDVRLSMLDADQCDRTPRLKPSIIFTKSYPRTAKTKWQSLRCSGEQGTRPSVPVEIAFSTRSTEPGYCRYKVLVNGRSVRAGQLYWNLGFDLSGQCSARRMTIATSVPIGEYPHVSKSSYTKERR